MFYAQSSAAAGILIALCLQAKIVQAQVQTAANTTHVLDEVARQSGLVAASQDVVHSMEEYTQVKTAQLVVWSRFDVAIKLAFAENFLRRVAAGNHTTKPRRGSARHQPYSEIPVRAGAFASAAYTEHIRIWSGTSNVFEEPCDNTEATRFAHPTCKKGGSGQELGAGGRLRRLSKSSATAFVDSFQRLLLSMRASGYIVANSSAIPVCRARRLKGAGASDAAYVVLNGAHRVAAAAALGITHLPTRQMQSCPPMAGKCASWESKQRPVLDPSLDCQRSHD